MTPRSSQVFWYYRQTNDSPLVTAAYLARERAVQLPGQYAREHENTVVDAADSFTSVAEVDAAMGTGWTQQVSGQPGATYEHFWDLGAVHDPTVGSVGHVDGNLLFLDHLVTFQGSRERPVLLPVVKQAIKDLALRFPPKRIRIESWQGLSVAQELTGEGLPVELFTPTAKSNSEEWPCLSQRLSGHTLVLFPHARLREELLNLTYEVGPSGVRVIDKGRIHQDHAVAVRGVCAGLAAPVLAPFMFFSGGRAISSALHTAVEAVTDTIDHAAQALTGAIAVSPHRPRQEPVRRKTFEEMQCLMRGDLTPDERERFDKEVERRQRNRVPSELERQVMRDGYWSPENNPQTASPGDLTAVLEQVRQRFAMWR